VGGREDGRGCDRDGNCGVLGKRERGDGWTVGGGGNKVGKMRRRQDSAQVGSDVDTHRESFGIDAVFDQGDAVGEALAVEMGVLCVLSDEGTVKRVGLL